MGSSLISPGWSSTGAVTGSATYQLHELQAGEDLATVAQRRLGAESRWTEIADLNGLRPPYVSTAGLPDTAAPGRVILLPADASASTVGVAAPASEASEDAIYGVDVWRRDGRDLVPVSLSGIDLDDFAYRRGLANCTDALGRRISTALGALRVWPGYGMPDLVGEPNLQQTSLLLAHATEQLQRDDRVISVDSPTARDLGDGAAVDLTAVLVGGRSVALTAA